MIGSVAFVAPPPQYSELTALLEFDVSEVRISANLSWGLRTVS